MGNRGADQRGRMSIKAGGQIEAGELDLVRLNVLENPGGSSAPARLRFKRKLNNFTITIPRIAMASTLATRATALLMPEAVPARSWSTELITTVVRGATLIAIPRPRTMNAGKNAFQ